MRSRVKLIMIALFYLIIILGSFCLSLFPKVSDTYYASGDESDITYSLLGKDYDFELKSDFTPFDFIAKQRMSGSSARFNQDSFGQFSQSFIINCPNNLSSSQDWEIGLWAYFSTKNLNDISIRLSNDSDSEILFYVSSYELEQLLNKQTEFNRLDQEEDGYSWNYIELPFSCAEMINAINGVNYVQFNSLSISCLSSTHDDSLTYADILVYDLKIEKTTLTSATVKESNKQDFRIIDLNFYDETVLKDVYIGDELTLEGRLDLINYAWVGQFNLKNDFSYSVEAYLDNSSGESTWELQGTKTMQTAGENVLKVILKQGSKTALVSTISFMVSEFTGIAFNQKISEFVVGKMVCFNLTKNNKLTNLSDLRFTIIGDCAKIKSVDKTNLQVYVEMVSVGSFQLLAQAVVDRPLKSNITVNATKNFSVIAAQDSKNNSGLIIALSVFLSGACALGLFFGIKAIIKANKYKVR